MLKVCLHNIRFFANHGLFPEETILGNWFVVNVSVEGDFLNTNDADTITNTINYQKLHEIVTEEMNETSKLLEDIINRIAKRIELLSSQIEAFQISIKKENPPLGGQVEASEVIYKWSQRDGSGIS